MALDAQYQTNVTPAADGMSAPLRIDSGRRLIITGEAAAPIPVFIEDAPGSTVWTQTSVTMDGSSKQLLAANANRTGLIVSNRIGNAQASYNIAGGTVTLINGIPLLGGDRDAYDGAATPVTAITGIGTNNQIVDVWEGT